MNLAKESSEVSAEDIIDAGRECIPIPNGVWEETELVNVSSRMLHCICRYAIAVFIR